MFKVEKRLKIESQLDAKILKVSSFNNRMLILLDNQYNLYLFDRELNNIVKELRLSKTMSKLTHKQIDIWHKNISFFSNGKIYIFQASGKLKNIKTLNFNEAEIKIIKYSNSGKYLTTIIDRENIYIYDRETYKLVNILTFEEEINNFQFSQDDRFITINFENSESEIFDLILFSRYKSISTDSLVLESLFFDLNKMFFITEDFKILEYKFSKETLDLVTTLNLSEVKLVKRLNKNIALISDEKKAFFFNLEKSEVIFEYEYSYDISALYLDDKFFYIAGKNGVDLIDINYKSEELEMSLMVKKYQNSLRCIHSNILLLLNEKFSKALDKGWSENLKIILNLIAQDKVEDAKKLAESFNKLSALEPYLEKEIEIKKLKEAVSTGNISLAYAVIDEVPLLKDTEDYSELEKYWLKVLAEGHSLAQMSDYTKTERTFKIFKNTKSKKGLIEAIFKNRELLNNFEQSAVKRDFKTFFEYINYYPFLKETETYKKVLINGSIFYDKFMILFKKKDFDKCIKLARILQNFDNYREDIIEKVNIIKYIKKIDEFLNSGNLRSMLRVINDKQYLLYLEDSKSIISIVEELFDRESQRALSGNCQELYNEVDNFKNIEFFQVRVDNIFKLTILNDKIENGVDNIQKYEKKFENDNLLSEYNREYDLKEK